MGLIADYYRRRAAEKCGRTPPPNIEKRLQQLMALPIGVPDFVTHSPAKYAPIGVGPASRNRGAVRIRWCNRKKLLRNC